MLRVASLLSERPSLELRLEELQAYLPGWIPGSDRLEVTLRAFDPREENGPQWVASARTWPD